MCQTLFYSFCSVLELIKDVDKLSRGLQNLHIAKALFVRYFATSLYHTIWEKVQHWLWGRTAAPGGMWWFEVLKWKDCAGPRLLEGCRVPLKNSILYLDDAYILIIVFIFLQIIFYIIATIGVVLTKYHTVSELLKLLSNDTLDTREKISIILTIGHCTEVCGKIFFFFLSVFIELLYTNNFNGIIYQDWKMKGNSFK